MSNLKPSLLKKVEHIEEEATAMIAQAHDRVATELTELKQRTQTSKDFIQEKAAQTSRSILEEHTATAKKEAQQIGSHSKSIADQIRASAEKNRTRTLEKARLLFNEEFGTNL